MQNNSKTARYFAIGGSLAVALVAWGINIDGSVLGTSQQVGSPSSGVASLNRSLNLSRTLPLTFGQSANATTNGENPQEPHGHPNRPSVPITVVQPNTNVNPQTYVNPVTNTTVRPVTNQEQLQLQQQQQRLNGQQTIDGSQSIDGSQAITNNSPSTAASSIQQGSTNFWYIQPATAYATPTNPGQQGYRGIATAVTCNSESNSFSVSLYFMAFADARTGDEPGKTCAKWVQFAQRMDLRAVVSSEAGGLPNVWAYQYRRTLADQALTELGITPPTLPALPELGGAVGVRIQVTGGGGNSGRPVQTRD